MRRLVTEEGGMHFAKVPITCRPPQILIGRVRGNISQNNRGGDADEVHSDF